MPNTEITSYGRAGTVTQSGARVKTIACDGHLAAGLPLKLNENGQAIELAAGDHHAGLYRRLGGRSCRLGSDLLFRDARSPRHRLHPGSPCRRRHAESERPVYFDPANHVYTNTAADGLIQLPAQFAVNGVGSGVGEIRVFPCPARHCRCRGSGRHHAGSR